LPSLIFHFYRVSFSITIAGPIVNYQRWKAGLKG
jgi:hypothetical protein